MNVDPVVISITSLAVSLVSLGLAIYALTWDKKKWVKAQTIDLRCMAISDLNLGHNFNHIGLNLAQVGQLKYISVHVNNTGSRNVTLMTIALQIFKEEFDIGKGKIVYTVILKLPTEHASKLPCELSPGTHWQGAFLQPDDLDGRFKGMILKVAVFENISGVNPHYVDLLDGRKVTAQVIAQGNVGHVGIVKG